MPSTSSKKKKRHCSDSSENDDGKRRKKEKKEKKKREKLSRFFGYSNEDNPFGDSNLTQSFVWEKKKNDSSSKEQQREDLVAEIRKVRERRDAREAEKEEFERLKQEESRLKDLAQYEDWQHKEEEFHLNQTKIRSIIRIQERRTQCVDSWARPLLVLEEYFSWKKDPDHYQKNYHQMRHSLIRCWNRSFEEEKSLQMFHQLSIDELDQLLEGVDAFLDLSVVESEGSTIKDFVDFLGFHVCEYWKCVRILCLEEKIHNRSDSMNNRQGIHQAVEDDINHMFEKKSYKELVHIEQEIESNISNPTPGMDVEYFETVLKKLCVFKAKSRLKEMYNLIRPRIEDVKKDKKQFTNEMISLEGNSTSSMDQLEKDGDRIGVDDSTTAISMQKMEEEKGLEEEEERLGLADEIQLQKTYKWSEKYRPRKPRYFNRVKTGFDWNKYNQTHYDPDNPPPKIVQGYKFNLFYPDLIDKSITPKFYIEKTNSTEFCILRFSAGPPYQDIAFKIVNREWEYGSKRGFKSVFERGILHLYFNFKRHRYRR